MLLDKATQLGATPEQCEQIRYGCFKRVHPLHYVENVEKAKVLIKLAESNGGNIPELLNMREYFSGSAAIHSIFHNGNVPFEARCELLKFYLENGADIALQENHGDNVVKLISDSLYAKTCPVEVGMDLEKGIVMAHLIRKHNGDEDKASCEFIELKNARRNDFELGSLHYARELPCITAYKRRQRCCLL